MTTLIYVHGTGTRKEEYNKAFNLIKEKVSHFKEIKVESCLWGDPLGVRLNKSGASIPDYYTTRSIGETPSDDESIGLWELLYTDPLFELKTFYNSKDSNGGFIPGRLSSGKQLKDEFEKMQLSPVFGKKIKDIGLNDIFSEAWENVFNSSEFEAAAGSAAENLSENTDIIARAITAEAFNICEEKKVSLLILYDPVLRDDFVDSLTKEIGITTYRSIFSKLAKPLISLTTNFLKKRRNALTENHFTFPGDILLYQARGDGIRNFIRDRIKESNSPVVLIAHSLGGIACVDLLVKEHLENVKLLVTFGSQAPFLYEINALCSLQFTEAIPDHFPRWLNIYNLLDFLSYKGAGVFPGKVTDLQVEIAQPFPKSHAALTYLSNKETWNKILKEIQEIHK